MRKRWILGPVAVLILLGMSVPAAGAGGSPKDPKARGQVDRSAMIELQPATDSKRFPGQLTAKGLNSEDAVIYGKGHFRFGDSPISYHVTIDRKNGTYVLTERPSPKVKAPKEKRYGKSPRKSLPSSTTQTAANTLSSTGYLAGQQADISLITQDPPQIDLARTENHMEWNIDDLGIYEWWYWYDCIPWWGDGAPYPKNTHWYNDTCSMLEPWLDSQGVLQNDLWATYYNYDWADDNLITNANHSVLIHADGTGFDWEFYHGVSGESSYLLDADLWVNGIKFQ